MLFSALVFCWHGPSLSSVVADRPFLSLFPHRLLSPPWPVTNFVPLTLSSRVGLCQIMDDDAKGGISPAEFQKGMLEFNNTNVSDEAAASLFEYYSASGGPKVRSPQTQPQPTTLKRSLPRRCPRCFVMPCTWRRCFSRVRMLATTTI